MIGKCKICNNYKNDWCEKVVDSPDPDILRDCRYFSHMTNADRIRAMSDEELADEFMGFFAEVLNTNTDGYWDFSDGFRDDLLKDLRQPVKDGEGDG